MSVEDHKLIVRRFYDEVVSAGHLDVVDELAHEDMHDRAAMEMGLGSGRGGFRRHVKAVRIAVPDFSAEIDQLVAEDDLVVVYWRGSGTPASEFVGVAAGTAFSLQAISQVRFEAGRIAEYQVMVGPVS